MRKEVSTALEIWQEKKGLFQKPWEIDNSIFSKNPLLGCYFLISADTWVIVNLICSDFGKPGYKYKVEQAVKKPSKPTHDSSWSMYC